VRSLPPRLRGAALALLFTVLMECEPADAESAFQLGAWEGVADLDYANSHIRTRSTDDSIASDSAQRRWLEELTIRNRGWYFYDPALDRGTLGVTIGQIQGYSASAGQSDRTRARIDGYSFEQMILPDFAYSGLLYANRTQSYVIQPFSHTQVASRNLGADARMLEDNFLRRWRIRHFTSNLRVERQHLEELTTPLVGQPYRRDELRRTLVYDGANGFETADLDWRLQSDDVDNRLYPAGSYRSYTASGNFSVDFGPWLNRRFDSHVSQTSRTGLNDTSLLITNERLHIDHYTNLATDQLYGSTRVTTRDGIVTTQSGASGVDYRPFRNLDASAQVSVSHGSLPTGTRDDRMGRLDLSYSHALPWHGKLYVTAGGRERLDDNQLTAARIAVVDEAHAAPAVLGAGAGFLLDQSFADPTAIEVVDTRGGARLPTALGIDYDIVAEGNRTRVVPLVTSAVIHPDDPLVVSYAYAVDPSIRYRTSSRSITAGVTLRNLSVAIGHERSVPTLLAGQDGRFLIDERRDHADVELRADGRVVRGGVAANWVRYDSNRLSYTQRRLSEFTRYQAMPNLDLGLVADWSVTDFETPQRRTDARSVRLTADYYAPRGWWATASVSRRTNRDTTAPFEAINEAMLRARWDYGKFTIDGSLTGGQSERGPVRLSNWGLDIHASRRF
jgi:hypothetical protein